jgi:hypothetical protein
MCALVHLKVFGNPVLVRDVGIFPPCLELFHRDRVRTVSINLIGRHVNEWRLRARPPCRFQQVQGGERIHFEIQKWNGRSPVMRWLGSAMHNDIGPRLFDQCKDSFAVSDVEAGVLIVWNVALQALPSPRGIAFGSEKDGAVVIVDSEDLKTTLREE